ncbi:MAG TPA: DNA primase [Acidothermaceae bacterium]|nr:DNA primase [Acidothermaceae bacterium]
MAGRIPDSDIARVRELSPVVDVISEHVTLKSAGGGSMKGLCPFHDERSPSFNVTPARGFWHCFGCGEGGDVISFVQKIDHLSFTEAVERLAARVGYELHYEQGGSAPRAQQGQRARLVEAHKAAAEFYAEQLTTAEAVIGRTFLDERGFDSAAAAQFGVGYAPNGWEHLVKHLRGRGFTDEELATGGLASRGQRGLIDRFRGRLVWPIRDVTGDVVGFGARKLRDDDDGPKYLNTPESPLYKKSQVLYGIDLAKREMAKARQAVVVEGYTDVMACHLAGVTTAVATCGTAFGDEHVRMLRRLLLDSAEYAGEVIFTFDGDSAGQKAALRAFESDQKFVTHTFVAISPDNMDPCELRIAKGDAAVRDLVARRQPLFEFAIRSVLAGFDLEIPEGRVGALDRTMPLVASIKDTSLRDEYARRLAGWVGSPDELGVLERVRRIAGTSNSRQSRSAQADRPDPRDPTLQVEREALKLAVQRPALLGPAFDLLDPLAFTHLAYAEVRDAVAKAGGTGSTAGGDAWVTAVLEGAVDDRVRALITELVVEAVLTANDPDERYARAQLAQLRVRALDRQIAEVKSRLQRLNPVEHVTEYNRLFGDLVMLEKRRRDDLDGTLGVA